MMHVYLWVAYFLFRAAINPLIATDITPTRHVSTLDQTHDVQILPKFIQKPNDQLEIDTPSNNVNW